MGFIIHFYIIIGTSLLTQGPVQIAVFLPISVFRRKGISNRVQTERNLRESYFWNKRNPGDLEWMSRSKIGVHEGPVRALGGGHAPTLMGPSWLPWPTSFAYIYIYLRTTKTSRSTTKPYFHRRNLLYPWDPVLGPFLAICRRGIQSRRASTSTPWPLRWSISSLSRTFGSIVIS